jgi:hypothetical protein
MSMPPQSMPPVAELDISNTHRLVPTEYRPGKVFREVANEAEAKDADLIASATGLPQQQHSTGLAGISHRELVYGVPNSEIVRNAFRFPGDGGRFHDRTRGAWYAADDENVAIHEVAYHLVRRLKTSRGIQVSNADFPYDDWQADFHADFYRLDSTRKYARYLQPELVPECYAAGQELARRILLNGGNGIVYPSVRFPDGVCVACFRPALVYRPRLTGTYVLTITLEPSGGHRVLQKKRK